MASELIAAFRAVLTFLVLSWGAFMYLMFYRIPAIDSEYVLMSGQEAGKEEQFIDVQSDRLLKSYRQRDFDSKDADGLRLDFNKTFRNRGKNEESLHLGREWFSDNRKPEKLKESFDSLVGLGIPSLCRELSKVEDFELLGQGYTKTVRKAVIKGKGVAVKTVHHDGHDMKTCMERNLASDRVRCLNLAKYKLLREALLLSQLKTPYVVQFLGACMWSAPIRGKRKEYADDETAVITELGKPLSLLEIIRLAWDERFKISLDLLLLLDYLSDSPYGSLTITDFKIDQFVIVDNIVKLSDVDDLDNHAKNCTTRHDCFLGDDRWNTTLPCVNSECLHYNEKLNLYNLDRLFLEYILDFENPRGLETELAAIAKKIRRFECRAREVLEYFRQIIGSIKSGKYALRWETTGLLKTSRRSFKKFQGAYVPRGLYDYYCQRSRSLSSCELNVHDVEEAEVACALDKSCKAVVVTPNFNWLGQKIVILKTNSKILMSHSEYSVLVKE